MLPTRAFTHPERFLPPIRFQVLHSAARRYQRACDPAEVRESDRYASETGSRGQDRAREKVRQM